MRLVIDVDKQYKKLFIEAAKAKVQVDEHYLTEEEEKGLLKLIEAGKKEGRLTAGEQANFKSWLSNR